jgi:hypothetical protein
VPASDRASRANQRSSDGGRPEEKEKEEDEEEEEAPVLPCSGFLKNVVGNDYLMRNCWKLPVQITVV